jgi:hypothetical protein
VEVTVSSVPGPQPDEPTGLRAAGAESTPELASRSAAGAGPAPELAPRSEDDSGGADTVTGELDQLADRPLAEHPEAYERIHARLQESLAEIDDA